MYVHIQDIMHTYLRYKMYTSPECMFVDQITIFVQTSLLYSLKAYNIDLYSNLNLISRGQWNTRVTLSDAPLDYIGL